VFAGLKLGQQLLDGPLDLAEFLNECLAIHYRVISRCLRDCEVFGLIFRFPKATSESEFTMAL
jgi:hypothetical protein